MRKNNMDGIRIISYQGLFNKLNNSVPITLLDLTKERKLLHSIVIEHPNEINDILKEKLLSRVSNIRGYRYFCLISSPTIDPTYEQLCIVAIKLFIIENKKKLLWRNGSASVS